MSWLPSWAWWIIGFAVAAAVLYAALPWLAQPIVRAILWPRYRLCVVGQENVPRTGPVLLAANHVTWLDGLFVAAVAPRRGKALVNASYVALPVIRQIFRRAGLIAVPASGPHGQRAAIAAARASLDRGEALLIFPEAQMTRNGLTGAFYRGLEVILKGREQTPVIPVFLDNVWGSTFSFAGGGFFRSRPQGLRHTVVVVFGPPVELPVTAFAVRQAVVATGVRAREQRGGARPPLHTIDLTLPHLEHPQYGLLAVSTPDFDQGGIRQTGQKPGTVGQAAPGVALRVVGPDGRPLPADAEGRLQVLLPGRPGWVDAANDASIDRDGFVRLILPNPVV